MEELVDKLGFVQTSLFLNRFLSSFLFFCFTVMCECYLHWIDGHVANLYCDLTWVWHVQEQVCELFEVCQHEFCQLTFAAWRLLKTLKLENQDLRFFTLFGVACVQLLLPSKKKLGVIFLGYSTFLGYFTFLGILEIFGGTPQRGGHSCKFSCVQ